MLGFGNGKDAKGVNRDAPKKKGIALFLEIFIREFWQIIKLNAVFVLFCLPIITIPAAIAAMSRITYLMVEDEPRFLFFEFRSTVKQELWRALGVGAGFAASGGLVYFAAGYYLSAAVEATILLAPAILALAAGALLLMMSCYAFPMLGVGALPIKAILGNAFRLVFLCPGRSILALVFTLAASLVFWGFLPVSLLLCLILFSLTNLLAGFAVHQGLVTYVFPGQAEAAPAEPQDP